MIKNSRLVKSIAAALSAAIVLLSPGVGSYSALAADFAAPPAGSAPVLAGGWAPRLQTLAAVGAAGTMPQTVIGGVDVRGVLRDLSTVDLNSAQGRLEASPVFERLSAAQAAQPRVPLTPEQIYAAVAGAAAAQREAAAAVAARVQKGEGDPAELATGLRQAARHWALLGEEGRASAAAAAKTFATRLEAEKKAGAERTVADTIIEWSSAQESASGPSAGTTFAAASARLARARAAASAAPAAAVERPAAVSSILPQIKRQRRSKDAAGVALTALPLVAAVAAAALIPGISPLLMITGGVMASILLHESAHLYMLRRLGDDTAASHGVTGVNPLKLVSPLGTLAVPFFTAIVSQLAFGMPIVLGWAKPIPVDFNKLADPKKDSMKVALAGPAMNVAIAAAAMLTAFALMPLHAVALPVFGVLLMLAKINVALAAFNMIPLPQLDGGKVLVGLLPQNVYDRWTANKRLPEAYQSTFKKLYEGPSTLLNYIGIDGQGRVNMVTRAITAGVFGLAALAGYAWLGAPVMLLMLVCSYDYYCIREKIQNEEATRSLMDLLTRFSSALAQEAENDDSIQSVINTEEVEHILKNALEDTIDKVVDTEGFDELSPEQKMERFEAAYMDAAVDALKKKGMSADDPETIRRVLTKLGLGALAKGWISKYDVWTKWHSPLRKKKKSLRDSVKEKGKQWGAGGGSMGMLAIGLLGTGLLAAHGMAHEAGAVATAGMAMLAGTLSQTPKQRQPAFVEALNDENLRLTDKEKAFLQRMLKEMKLEHKPPMTGRTKELEQLLKAITSPRGVINSAVFVGKKGVGKTSVVELLAQMMAQSDAMDFGTFKLTRMNGRFLVKLNLARLLQQDDPAAALDALLEILGKFNSDDKRTGNKVILFVDEIHQIFMSQAGEKMANLLKEPLRDGELTIIAATTDAEYKKYMEKDEAFRDRMIPIWLDEPTPAETLRQMENAKGYYEGLFGVQFTPEALKAAADMAKFDQEVFRPRSAFNFMNAAAAASNFETRRDALSMKISDKIGDLRYVMGRLAEELATTDRLTQNVKDNEPTTVELYNLAIHMTQELVKLYRERAGIPQDGIPVVTDELVKEEIARKTGVASGQLTLGNEPIEKYLEMEKIVGAKVIGQDEAIATIAKAVRQNKAGLSDPKRPMGVFYLTGPTGSGKTHLAKELARFLFNDPDAVIRVDMTEYQESHAKSRMIGSPPGYVGFEAGGQLTEAVRKKPYSVILLDEIEKAHPDVFLLLLQIMGEGRLTDGQGRLVDFKNTMILMTSNLGMFAVDVEQYARAFKQLQEQKRAAALAGDEETITMLDAQMKALAQKLSEETKKKSVEITEQAFKETYPPEFQGRLHAPPIVFNRITPADALRIAELNLRELRGVLGFAGHEIEWTPQVVEHVVNEGFSVALGARPLQNAIDRLITQPISTEILQAALKNGQKVQPSKIKVSMEQGRVKIDVAPLEAKAPEKRSPGEGAAREVFASAISAAAAAAAGSATLPGIEAIDELVQQAMAAYPDEAPSVDVRVAAREPVPANEDSRQVSETFQQAQPAAAPAPASSVYAPNASPNLGAGTKTFGTTHYENERKDPAAKAGLAELAAALSDWPRQYKDLVLRTIEDPSDPGVGFFKLFLEQAKRMTPADQRTRPVDVAYDLSGPTAKFAFSRPGTLGEAELKVLRNHFTGPVPADGVASRDKAEAMNAFMGEDGRRLMFDLYRKLSAIPGARLGWWQGDDSVEYWLELPKPAAEPPPAPPSPPSDGQAAATPSQSWPLDASKTGLADATLKQAHNAANLRMQELGYPRDSRIVASAFTTEVADKLKALGNAEGLAIAYSVEREKTVIVLTRTRPLSEEEADAVRGIFGSNLELAHGIADTWSEMTLLPNGARIEVPHTGAVSQGDGFARSTEGTAAAPSAERAGKLAKLESLPDTLMSNRQAATVWIVFEGLGFAAIKRTLDALGLEYLGREDDALTHVKARVPDPANAAATLLPLFDEPGVVKVKVNGQIAGAVREALVAGPARGPRAALAKLQAAPQNALDDRSLWVSFEASSAAEIAAVLARSGGTAREHATNGRFARVRLSFATPAKAAAAALKLSAETLVRSVSLEARTLRRARALEILSQRTDDEGTTPLTVAITLKQGADPAALTAWLGTELKFVESPHAGRPNTVLKAVFVSQRTVEERVQQLAERADVEKIVVGPDAYRALTEGTVTPRARSGGGLKDLARELALRILEQGDQRSTSVRVAAADLLAASSDDGDLELARDWIRFDTTISNRWPELAAAAELIGRHGSRSDDEARLLRAMGYLGHGNYGSDLYKPAKRRLYESLAKLLSTGSEARALDLLTRYQTEKDKPSKGWNDRVDETTFSRYKNDVLLDALYIALCKNAGPEALDTLLRDFEFKRALPLFEYLKRVDPARLRALVETWRERHSFATNADRTLMWYAVAEYGTRADAKRLFDDASAGFNGTLDNQTKPLAGEAAARLVARTGAWDLVEEDVRRALRERMGDSGSFGRMITAVQVAGAAGEAQDLERLEELLRSNPEDVNYVHEMTQREAAMAWAALLHRLGLVDRYMTLTRPAPAGQPALPVLQSMLADVNPIVNEAAMEALRLRLTKPVPQRPAAPPAQGSPEAAAAAVAAGGNVVPLQGFFREGAPSIPAGASTFRFPPNEPLDADRPELARFTPARRADAAEWATRFGRILRELLGVSFDNQLRAVTRPDGSTAVVWVLRQAVTRALSEAQLSKVGQLVSLLLFMRGQGDAAREAQLRRLRELGYDDPEGLYALLSRLSADPDVRMGLQHQPAFDVPNDHDETELWLKFEFPAPPSTSGGGFTHPHAQMFDPLRPHGRRDPDGL